VDPPHLFEIQMETPTNPNSGMAGSERSPRRAWEAPLIVQLPKLTELTLLTGSGIPGAGSPGSASTVF